MIKKDVQFFGKKKSSNGFNAQSLKQINCIKGSKATYACFSKLCEQNPFLCSVNQCDCNKEHVKCFRFLVEDLAKKFYKNNADVANFIEQNNKFADSLIDKVIQQISNFKQWNEQFIKTSFNQKVYSISQTQFLTKLQAGKTQELNGKLFFKICTEIDDFQIVSLKQKEILFQKIIQNWNILRNSIQENFKVTKQRQNRETQKIQIKQVENKLPIFQNSNIIKTCEQVQIIHGFFDKKIKNFELLYKASQNQFKLANFYKNCQNVSNNILLIQTQFNRKIGGYTPFCWNKATSNTVNLPDKSMSTFTFSVTHNEKLTQFNEKSGIRYQLWTYFLKRRYFLTCYWIIKQQLWRIQLCLYTLKLQIKKQNYILKICWKSEQLTGLQSKIMVNVESHFRMKIKFIKLMSRSFYYFLFVFNFNFNLFVSHQIKNFLIYSKFEIFLTFWQFKQQIFRVIMTVQNISNGETIIGLLNGMIGGTILVLPILGLKTGYISILLICAVMGAISCYTAYLIMLHLGKAANIKESILNHFNHNQKFPIVYNIFIGLSFWPLLFTYFHLLITQITGLFDSNSSLIPLMIFIALLILTFVMRKFNIGAKLLAYGIISIFMYLAFITWAQFSAPKGMAVMRPFQSQSVNFAAALLMAYSIHDFVVQVMIKNPNRAQYPKLVVLTYILGTFAYTYISYGSFAILNRDPIKTKPQVIQDYFQKGQWQVTAIQLLYTIHLISAFPQFLIVSKVRILQIFGIQEQEDIEIKQVLYFILVISLSYLIYVINVDIAMLIEINGSIVGIIYVILIPIGIHIKCVYFDKCSGQIQGDEQYNSKIVANACECHLRYKNKLTKFLQIIWIIITIGIGIFITYYTLYRMFKKKQQGE